MALEFSIRDQIATVVLNRPEAMNAIDPETQRELLDCWQRIRADDGVRVVILTGTGERAFCTGSDLKKTCRRPTATLGRLRPRRPGFRLAARDRQAHHLRDQWLCAWRRPGARARLRHPHRGGACPLRPPRGARRLDSGRRRNAAPAAHGRRERCHAAAAHRRPHRRRRGLAPRHRQPGRAARRSTREAEAIAGRIAANAPLAVRAVKRLVKQGQGLPLDVAIAQERLTFGVLRDTEDRIEGRRAFAEKRKPVYKGR